MKKKNEINILSDKCKTKYPLLMVHGIFFRDWKNFNYWGRIPAALESNGATIFYGNHESCTTVENSAQELAARIQEIIETTGCEKVNIIAHSKGGLDCKCAISELGMAPYVASLTTVNTPFTGSKFASHVLSTMSIRKQKFLSGLYKFFFRFAGDKNPDLLHAVYDLTVERCTEFQKRFKPEPNIFYQGTGSVLNNPKGGRFPLIFNYKHVEKYDGPNDRLVGKDAFEWGENFKFVTVSGKRGVAHGDMIDLYREDIPGFDVKQFYTDIVSDLKNRGL
mgnify:CR=1 FL=1